MPTIRKRGDSYQAIVRVQKGGALIFQQSKVFPSKRLAKDWGDRLEADVKRNGPPNQQLGRITLGQLMRNHLRAMEEAGEVRRAKAGEIYLISTHFDDLPLDKLHPHDFMQFATKRRAAGAGAATVLHNLALVRASLAAARTLFGLDVGVDSVAQACDTLRRTGVVARPESRSRRLRTGELDKLLADFGSTQDHPSTRIDMTNYVQLAIALPRRRGELLRARWEDYDDQRYTLTLHDTKNPTAPRREVIPVPQEAVELLRRLPRTDDRILPYKEESVSAAFQRACKRCGLEDLRLHDLRHEGISRLFEAGYSTQEVALVSGHLSWHMLRRYTHLEAETVAAKMNKATNVSE